jgi:lysophospholipase L1-like esterase
MLTVHPPFRPNADMLTDAEMWNDLADGMADALRPAADAGVTILVENSHTGKRAGPGVTDREYGCDPLEVLGWRDALEMRLGKGTCGIRLDVGHARNNEPVAKRYPIGTWYAVLGRAAGGYHLHQTVQGPDGRLHNHHPIPAWEDGGKICFDGFLGAWRTGILAHAPVILEIREGEGALATWKRLRSFLLSPRDQMKTIRTMKGGKSMTLNEWYETYASDSVSGSANQVLTKDEKPLRRRGRVYYRLSHGGEKYSLLFSNRIDSTFSDGSISRANDAGGEWEILSLRVGLTKTRGEEPKKWHTVTFRGAASRAVRAGEGEFFTDPIPLAAEGGDCLCYEITAQGASYPYHEEITLTVECCENGEWREDRRIPVPLMIGSDRAVETRMGFIGDSITQGCGTARDSYTHWAAKIAEGLPPEISVWDLGIGFARAYDAATDGGWLARAKRCDVVNVCLGVNDLLRGRTDEELTADLTAVVGALKAAGCRVVLFTVPPFDYGEPARSRWYAVNRAAREGKLGGDALFDFADVLGLDEPDRHMARYGGHPDAEGCAAAAAAYLREQPWIPRP